MTTNKKGSRKPIAITDSRLSSLFHELDMFATCYDPSDYTSGGQQTALSIIKLCRRIAEKND